MSYFIFGYWRVGRILVVFDEDRDERVCLVAAGIHAWTINQREPCGFWAEVVWLAEHEGGMDVGLAHGSHSPALLAATADTLSQLCGELFGDPWAVEFYGPDGKPMDQGAAGEGA